MSQLLISAVSVGAAVLLSGCGNVSNTTAKPHTDNPVPAEQTEAQLVAFASRSLAAKAASDAATADVLTFFGSLEFKAAMEECCPLVAALSPQELLEAFRAETQVVELAHAFPLGTDSAFRFTDVTLDILTSNDWFLNEWEVGFLSGATESKQTPNVAATRYFGLPASPDTNYSWAEASDRMIYVAQNFFQQDFGSEPNFGNVTAIFDSSYVRNMVLIAPTDTGMWHMGGCDDSASKVAGLQPASQVDSGSKMPPGHSVNCSAWDGTVGTLDSHDHLILANFDIHADSNAGSTRVDKARAFFERSAFGGRYDELPNVSSNEYWESNIVGNPKLESVKFLIGNFPSLFGTDSGRKLQTVANELGFPLIWALGDGGSSGPSGKSTAAVAGNQRFLDPIVAHTNASLPGAAAGQFQELWQSAFVSREAGSVSPSDVASWWSSLLEVQVRLAPLTAGACSAASFCIGTTTASDDCICRNGSSSILV
jgi:hypothetical protein